MIQQITQTIIHAIQNNGPTSVFWGAIVEQLLGVLVPSPIVPMSAGFLLIDKDLSFLQILLPIIKKISFPYTLGVLLGASLFYWLGRFGGRVLVVKFGKYFGISWQQVEKFRQKFTRGFKDEILLFLLLVLPVTSISLVSVSSGLIGINAFEFYLMLFAGVLIRSVLLGILGWKVGETYQLAAGGLDKIETVFSVILLFLIFILIAFLYYRREKYFKKS